MSVCIVFWVSAFVLVNAIALALGRCTSFIRSSKAMLPMLARVGVAATYILANAGSLSKYLAVVEDMSSVSARGRSKVSD
jgi:hypothetical protein